MATSATWWDCGLTALFHSASGGHTTLQYVPASKSSLPPKLQAWVDARKRHHLSHVQVQMARELGMNPKNLGKLDNHRQEPWKAPLPQYIEYLDEKRFGRTMPDRVVPVEQLAPGRRSQPGDHDCGRDSSGSGDRQEPVGAVHIRRHTEPMKASALTQSE
jgi:hypothetical protein